MQKQTMMCAVVLALLTATGANAQAVGGNGTATGTAGSAAAAPLPAAPPVSMVTGATPQECMKTGNAWYSQTLASMTLEERRAKASATYTQQRNLVKDCGARFSVAASAPADLPGLTDYYAWVGDTTNARLSFERSLTATGLSERARGQVMVQGVEREYAKASGHFGIIDGMEMYAKQIDALPDSLIDIKIKAHNSILGHYEYLDVADGLENHAKALIALGRAAHKPDVMISGYSSLARASADKLHPDVALKILDDAEREIGPTATPRFKDFRHRYELIGTQAPPVSGKWWVNSPNRTGDVVPGNGKVTLVEFTAHWCGPCKNSYPGLRSVAEHFAGKPFQGAMATGLYGYIGTRRPLTQEQEVEADNEYFGTEHKLPFPVAINLNGPDVPGEYGPLLDRAYRVGGIPQIMIIDKKGVIRQIVTGWDQGNTARFTAYIEQLLAEK